LLIAAALLGAAIAAPRHAQSATDTGPRSGESGAVNSGAGAGNQPPTSEAPAAPSRFRSAEDGWLDISGFLDQVYGFVPIAMPITEPAVGYGVAGGLLFVDKPAGEASAGFGRPNLTAIGGAGTENGTRGAAAGDVRHWLDDRLQTLVAAGTASVNLDFYGIGEDTVLNDHPRSYNLEPRAFLVQAKYRLGRSRSWVGLGYALADTRVSFDAPEGTPGLPDSPREVWIAGIAPLFSYDSRDNIFTPLRGTYVEAAPGLFGPAFGGDDTFQRVNLIALQFVPLRPRLTLGVRGSGTLSFGDVPFFLRPYVWLRGAPAMRYQGEHAGSIEAEVRWQCWKRFSLVGFAGIGAAWNDLGRVDDTLSVVTGGGGFRYELARDYGLHMGLDVAFGPDTAVLYVVAGSAWTRP
jgi:hypothetical protein